MAPPQPPGRFVGHFTLGCKVKALTGTLWAGERQGEVRLEDVAWEKEAETSGGEGGAEEAASIQASQLSSIFLVFLLLSPTVL